MRFDLHIHSNHSSDCSLAIDDILKQAVKKGLDGIAICDHNTVKGSLLAKKRAEELNLPLLVLSGIEVSTAEGHVIILGIKENIPQNLTLQETIKIARERGGVVIAPHPFKIRSIGAAAKDTDAIETFNSRCIFGENKKAKELAFMLRKTEVGGSDSHMLATIGLGFTEIDADYDEGSVLKAIMQGRANAGGQAAPLYVVFIQFLRGLFRRLRRLGKELRSKILRKKA